MPTEELSAGCFAFGCSGLAGSTSSGPTLLKVLPQQHCPILILKWTPFQGLSHGHRALQLLPGVVRLSSNGWSFQEVVQVFSSQVSGLLVTSGSVIGTALVIVCITHVIVGLEICMIDPPPHQTP